MLKHFLLHFGLASSLFTSATTTYASTHLVQQADQQEKILAQHNPTMSKKALITAVNAYLHLREQGKDPQQILSFVNYDKPDNIKRLWVINMRTDRILFNTYVAQGKNTGLVQATHFSDKTRSLETSLGVFLTGKTYVGEHGQSLRLRGLDKGFNDNAYRRAIVMHSAWYVSQKFIAHYHHLGRSWGCLALSEAITPKVINTIKNGTVLVSYYPNKKWLASSHYIQPVAV